MLKLKEFLKKIPGVQYYTWFRSSKIRWPLKFRINECKIKFTKFRKKHGYSTNNDRELEKLKGIHKGERCVIIGMGPSLKMEDLERLKENGVITFACNRINKLFQSTVWRPDYYCLSDSTAFSSAKLNMDANALAQDLTEGHVKKMFFIENMKKYLSAKYKDKSDILFFRMSLVSPYSVKISPFSTDISNSISDMGTVACTCIQIAAYMGFESIYLYGMDHNYQKYLGTDGRFHVESSTTDYSKELALSLGNETDIIGENPPKTEYQAAIQGGFNDLRKFDKGYSICAEYAENNNIHIYNATRGGKLEKFERRSIDDLFNN